MDDRSRNQQANFVRIIRRSDPGEKKEITKKEEKTEILGPSDLGPTFSVI